METSIRLANRDQQIVDLLLQGCDNAEIANQLNMAHRTVKARFNRLFVKFGIRRGIKRVKLAVLLYRRQLCQHQQASATEHESLVSANIASSLSSPMDSRTKKSLKPSERLSTWSRTISASSTTSSDFGTESNSPCGTRLASTSNKQTHRESTDYRGLQAPAES
jgi:DNA-binding CsgD family transcriptional regulator